jgi:hypothetical protein
MLKHKKNNKDHASKDRNTRIMHVYASHQSSTDQPPKGASLPLKKNNKPSGSHPLPKPKEPPKREKPKSHASHPRIKPPEIYEVIPLAFANSSSNS